MSLFILTSQNLPKLCPDDENLVKVLQSKGLNSKVIVWDKEKVPSGATVLIRTVWDYVEKRAQFVEMLNDFKRRKIRCINPIETILWNMDKSYLLEFLSKGVNVTPSFIADSFSLESIFHSKIPYPLVLKPLVGASGRDTFLLQDSSSSVELSSLLGRSVLIQPFMSSIKEQGEISFIYFNKVFSHSVLKVAAEDEFRVQDDHGGKVYKYGPSEAELEEVAVILNSINKEWSYARVDVVKYNAKLFLMELELIEPELFFRFSKNGEEKFFAGLSQSL